MYPLHTAFLRIVNHRIRDTARFQHFKSYFGFFPEGIELAEFDRLRRTGFGARRLQSCALPVRAESTFECTAVGFILFHHAKGTTHNTIGTAVTYVRLNEDRPKLHAHDCAGGACFQAACHFAMLADVGREAPCRQLVWRVAASTGFRLILYKLYVTPR